MVALADFRAALRGADPLDIVDRFLLAGEVEHVSADKRAAIQRALCESFGSDPDDVRVIITGSAKLGFSIVEKARPGKPTLPRYRKFSGQSDIDVAVIAPPIFTAIWEELAANAHRAFLFPPAAGRLGDYLVCGWLRPDHFPKGVRLPKCDAWSDTFRKLSVSGQFTPRTVNGGLFASENHLRNYMARAVNECVRIEELQ